MSYKPGDKLRWRGEPVTFVGMVARPNGGEEPPALADVYVEAAWIRQMDHRIVPVPLDQLVPNPETLTE